MLPSMDELLAEHAAIERRLSDPAIHADQQLATSLGRRYAHLSPIVSEVAAHQRVVADLQAARELAAAGDEEFRIEAEALEAELGEIEDEIRRLLLPKDPNDDKDVILEIKAGEGGEESALFAADLLRMYLRYAERRGWKTEILDSVESDLGGYKDVSVAVKSRNGGVWPGLKFEGGVHRVQRVPVTESQGRIHTSAAGVFVFPEAADVEISIDPGELRIDVYRSSGPGGQSVNTTDSAVRITHLPTGLVVSCQNEKSQLQNKEQALRIMRARLLALAQDEQAAQESEARAGQVRTVDRSERVRTYNYPENRVADHRVGYKAHNLDAVLDGDLDAIVQALSDGEAASQLSVVEG
jgi:peptide chain release factor 1